MERLVVTVLYGLLVSFVWWRTLRTNSMVLKKVAAWMAVDWIASNILFEVLGPHAAPWVSPSIEAGVVVAIGTLAIAHRSWVAWAVVVLFVIQEIVSVTGFLEHTQGLPMYYAVMNFLFIIRIGLVGGAAGYAMVDRAFAGHRSPHRHHFGRSVG